MAVVTANSTDTLIQNFAQRSWSQLHSGINDIAGNMAGQAWVAKQFASTGTLDGMEISKKTATSLVLTMSGGGETGVETVSGKGLNVSNAAQTWTGIKSEGTWTDTNGASGANSGNSTFTYQPANPSSQLVLSKYTESGTDNWIDNDTSGKLKEGRDFAGTLTILSTDTGAFSAKLSSLSSTFDNSFTGGGTQVETFKVTSKAGVTLADGAAAGTFDTVNFTYKTTLASGATETPLSDSLVVSKADASVSSVLKDIMLGKYGTTPADSPDWVEFSDADYLAIGQAMFSGDDTITGTAYADTLNGYAGKDKIIGAVGNDTLTGGTGLDTLTGGLGADVFVFAAGDSGITATTLDSVTDFSSTQGDTIKLSGLSSKSYGEGSAAVKDFSAAKTAAETLMAAGKNVVFEFDAKGGYLFVDSNGDHSADMTIALTGVKAAASFGEGDVSIT
ncbi:MAG: Poly(beta-D-mannuronate) epimerase 5 [Pseudomonadota bacterium]|jgi:Ca2+-binding RTX toxin-like protein